MGAVRIPAESLAEQDRLLVDGIVWVVTSIVESGDGWVEVRATRRTNGLALHVSTVVERTQLMEVWI